MEINDEKEANLSVSLSHLNYYELVLLEKDRVEYAFILEECWKDIYYSKYKKSN